MSLNSKDLGSYLTLHEALQWVVCATNKGLEYAVCNFKGALFQVSDGNFAPGALEALLQSAMGRLKRELQLGSIRSDAQRLNGAVPVSISLSPHEPISAEAWKRGYADWSKGTMTIGDMRYVNIRIPHSDLESAFHLPTKAISDVAPTGGGNPNTVNNASDASNKASIEKIYKTGLPGKPTSWSFVEQEVRRRYAQNRDMKVAEWARAMHAWLTQEHPDAPPATEKTLKNKLSGLIGELKAGTEK